MKTARTMNVWQDALKEIEVSFAVENNHGDAMLIFRRAHCSKQVLGDYVSQQRCLARPGHAQNDPLHHSNAVRPQPRLAVHIVAEHHSLLLPGLARDALISPGTYNHGWVRPLSFPPRSSGHQQIQCRRGGYDPDREIAGQLGHLARREVIPLAREIPAEPTSGKNEDCDDSLVGLHERRIFMPSCIWPTHGALTCEVEITEADCRSRQKDCAEHDPSSGLASRSWVKRAASFEDDLRYRFFEADIRTLP